MAVAQRVGGAQTLGDPTLSEGDRIRHGEAVRERTGDGTGQRVAAAVVVAGGQPVRVELVARVAVVEQVTAALRRPQMPALDQHPLRPQRVQGLGRSPLRRGIGHVDVHQQPDLVEVRRHQGGQREQLAAQGVQRVGGQQRVTVHGRAHRVDHQRHRQLQPAPGRGHLGDDGRGRQHAGLGRLDADVAGDRLDLAGHHVGGHLVKAVDPQRVLHGHRGHGDAGVHAQHRHGAQVGLDARTTPESDPAMDSTRRGVVPGGASGSVGGGPVTVPAVDTPGCRARRTRETCRPWPPRSLPRCPARAWPHSRGRPG